VSKTIVCLALVLTAGTLAGEQSPAPATAVRVTGLHHVALRMTDAAASRGFYANMLGLRERSGGRGPRLAYAIGDQHSVVLVPGLPAAEDEWLSHIAFATTDVKELSARLTSRGVAVRQPPERCEETAVWATDPDGHPVEFVQVAWPPPVAAAPGQGALSTRLLHVGHIIRDEGRAHTFYRDALSFVEIWRGGRPEGVTRWVNMRVPDGTDYLEYMLVTDPPTRRDRGVLHHLALRVPDMQAAWEEVARRSQRFKQPLPGPPQVGVNGRYQLNLFDPDGTRVELMEPFTVR
jgi:catechol 2,3-dioxygenase-like lactoylglutathione lyase family enzyme